MSYRIAGIDVLKKKLAVVAANLKLGEEVQFERRWYGSTPEQLRALAEWFVEQQVEEVVRFFMARACKRNHVPFIIWNMVPAIPKSISALGRTS